MRNPYPQSINIVSVIRPSSLQLILWYDPLSPGIIALAPTRACHFPRARGTPHLGRQPRQPGDSEQLQQLPGRRTDLTPGQSYQARGEEKTGNSGGDLQREESSGGCDMTHDTWHGAGTVARCQPRVSPSHLLRPGSADCWVAGKPSLADEFPVTSSRSIPGPDSLLQSRSAVSPGPGPGHRNCQQRGINSATGKTRDEKHISDLIFVLSTIKMQRQIWLYEVSISSTVSTQFLTIIRGSHEDLKCI